MFKASAVAIGILAAIPLSVNASVLKDGERSTLKALVQTILKSGDRGLIYANVAKDLGLSGDLSTKFEGTDPEEAMDGLDRACHLVIEQTEKGPKPVCMLIRAAEASGSERAEWWIRLSLDGTPELVDESHGSYNPDGSVVKGSGVGRDRRIDLASKQARQLIRHELDYWLHNKYRTKLGKLRLTNPNATMADVEAHEAKAMGDLKAEEAGAGGGVSADKSAAGAQEH